MSITLNDLLRNPTGKGSGHVYARYKIKNSVRLDFIQLLRRFRKQFTAVPYVYNNGDVLYHIRVPSSKYDINKVIYDVLFFIEFDKYRDYLHREIHLFCNSPSFVYTYAYVANAKGYLIDDIKDRLPSVCLTQAPAERNPDETFGFEKIISIAALYLIEGFCLRDSYMNKYKVNMNGAEKKMLYNNIATSEKLEKVYQYALYNSRKFHKKELSKSEKARREKLLAKHKAAEKKRREAESSFLKKPRSKITARKATKSLFNNGRKSHTIKPKKSTFKK